MGDAALSLVTNLTRLGWSLSGQEMPQYSRKDTPYRFVSGQRK